MRRSIGVSGVVALALLIAACSEGSDDAATGDVDEGVTYVGADGVESEITDTSRIITLSGDLTEIIFEFGLGDSVVAVDVTTVYPEEATSLPIIGVGRFLTAEGVLAQQPTLVIGDTQTDPASSIEQIRAAGVPVVILDVPASFEDLYDKIGQMGTLLGAEAEADRLAERVRGEVDAALEIAAGVQTKRMAYIYTRGPDVVLFFGDGMVTNPLIEGAAGIDTGAEAGIEGTIPATAEAIVAAAPEVIIVPEEGFGILGGLDAFLQLPGVAQTPAGQSGAVLAYPEGDFLTFGPRVGQSLALLIQDVHGLP